MKKFHFILFVLFLFSAAMGILLNLFSENVNFSCISGWVCAIIWSINSQLNYRDKNK